MDERFRVAGKSILLRNIVVRWLEYTCGMAILFVVTLALGKWQSWNLSTLLVLEAIVAAACAAVASLHNLRLLDSVRRERALTRAARQPLKN